MPFITQEHKYFKSDNIPTNSSSSSSSSSTKPLPTFSRSAPTPDPNQIAPLIIACFDIECIGHNRRFPCATNPEDQICMVATSLLKQGESEASFRHIITTRNLDNLYTLFLNNKLYLSINWYDVMYIRLICFYMGLLGPCDPIPNAQVIVVENERDLLEKWRQFILSSDPDVLLGYNQLNFDLPYMVTRAELHDLTDFCELGRIQPVDLENNNPWQSQRSRRNPQRLAKTKVRAKMISKTTTSRAHGTNTVKSLDMPGRIQLDLYRYLNTEHKLQSYSLNYVSEHFLQDTKEDVPYWCIAKLFAGSPADVATVARYCIKDTLLPLRILVKLDIVINLIGMARVTGVPVGRLVTRGQQYKVFFYSFSKPYPV